LHEQRGRENKWLDLQLYGDGKRGGFKLVPSKRRGNGTPGKITDKGGKRTFAIEQKRGIQRRVLTAKMGEKKEGRIQKIIDYNGCDESHELVRLKGDHVAGGNR